MGILPENIMNKIKEFSMMQLDTGSVPVPQNVPSNEQMRKASSPSGGMKDILEKFIIPQIETNQQTPVTTGEFINEAASGIKNKDWISALTNAGKAFNSSGAKEFMAGFEKDPYIAVKKFEEAEKLKGEEQALKQQGQKDYNDKFNKLVDLYKGFNSVNKGGSSFKQAVDIYKAQGLIDDETYNSLISNPSYINDEYFPTSTLNKFLDPYLIDKRQSGAEGLEGIKQGNRKELKEIGLDYDKQLDDYKAGNQKEIIDYKENLLSSKLDNAKNYAGLKNLGKGAFAKDIAETQGSLSLVNDGMREIEAYPGAYSYILGSLPPEVINRLDSDGIKIRAKVDNITATYRKWLTGAQMSDRERKDYERFLPAPKDNGDIVFGKLKAMQDVLNIKLDEYKEAEQSFKVNLNQFGLPGEDIKLPGIPELLEKPINNVKSKEKPGQKTISGIKIKSIRRK